MPELYTIGHSNYSWERFLELLRVNRIEAIADVRTSPYSARFPQFNRASLESGLEVAGIRYVFLGKELGARRAERECYVGGIARYEQIAELPAFHAGLERVHKGVARFRLSLLCAEKDPLTCHRTLLVCRRLSGLAINHILETGALEPHAAAESRLMAEEGVGEQDLFAPREVLLARAYDQRGARTAYREGSEPANASDIYGERTD